MMEHTKQIPLTVDDLYSLAMKISEAADEKVSRGGAHLTVASSMKAVASEMCGLVAAKMKAAMVPQRARMLTANEIADSCGRERPPTLVIELTKNDEIDSLLLTTGERSVRKLKGSQGLAQINVRSVGYGSEIEVIAHRQGVSRLGYRCYGYRFKKEATDGLSVNDGLAEIEKNLELKEQKIMNSPAPNLHVTCARAAHEANRAYCFAFGDTSQSAWDDAPDWQKESAIAGVEGALAGSTPEQSHEGWLERKKAEGWAYGAAKDSEAKTHPCMKPYADLSAEHKAKDQLYLDVVRAVAKALGSQ